MRAESMPGIPEHLLIAGVLLILLLTFGLVELMERGRHRRRGYWRYDLLRFAPLRRVMESRLLQPVLQLPVVALFLLIILAGLMGEQRPDRNIATVLTWVVWWALLVFVLVVAGKVWCTVCPWNAISDWVRRRSLWKRVRDEELFTLNLKWPDRLKNIYLATGFFVLLTWLELGLGVTGSPRITAYLGLLILVMALVPAVLFEGKPFCRYACLVGRISGLYAMFSPVELRSRSKRLCRRCRSRDCHRGNERGYPCPTFESLHTMDSNTYCILCTECVKSCRHGNVALNLRTPAADLMELRKPRRDEALLSLVMLSMTSFHGITMTPQWFSWLVELQERLSVGYYAAFTLMMLVVLTLFPAVFYVVCVLSRRASGSEVPVSRIFINYAYPLLPIALFYHLAHNTMHFFREGQKLLPVLSDPFGWGWNLFGTAGAAPEPLLSFTAIWYLQVFFIVLGHVFSILVASKVARITFAEQSSAFRSLLPQLAVLVGYSAFSLWLIAQPMVMRTSM